MSEKILKPESSIGPLAAPKLSPINSAWGKQRGPTVFHSFVRAVGAGSSSLSLSLSLALSLSRSPLCVPLAILSDCMLSPAFLAPGVSVLGQQSSHCIWHRFSAEKPCAKPEPELEHAGTINRRYRFLVKTSGAWPRASRAKASNPHRYPPGRPPGSPPPRLRKVRRRIRLYPGSGPGVAKHRFHVIG